MKKIIFYCYLSVLICFGVKCSASTVFVSQSGGSISCGIDGTQGTTALASVTWTAGNTYKLCGTITSAVTIGASGSSGSPVIQKGTNLTSTATGSLSSLANDTTKGNLRGSLLRPTSGAWDIGAYQFPNTAPSLPFFAFLSQ